MPRTIKHTWCRQLLWAAKTTELLLPVLAAVFLAINTGISHKLVGMHTCTWKKSMQLLTFLQSQYNAPSLCHSYNGIRCAVEHKMYCNDNRIRSTNIYFYELFLESQAFPPGFFCLQYIVNDKSWVERVGMRLNTSILLFKWWASFRMYPTSSTLLVAQ